MERISSSFQQPDLRSSSTTLPASRSSLPRSSPPKVPLPLPWKGSKETRSKERSADSLSTSSIQSRPNEARTPTLITGHFPSRSSPIMVTPRSTGRASPVTRRGETAREKDQWWENVLPPGQLAERLRRAQSGEPSTPSFASHVQSHEPARSPYKQSLRTSAADLRPSKRTSSRHTIHGDQGAFLSPPSTLAARNRASTASSHSSSSFVSSLPPSSARSSVSMGELSSASSSNDEGSGNGHHSPVLTDDWHAFGAGISSERGSGTTSPTASISRSQSNRRRRVLASPTEEVGVGLGVNIRGSKGQLIDLDERFRQWNDGMPFHHLHGQSASGTTGNELRPFPSSSVPRSVHAAYQHGNVFADTPDHSSEEDRTSVRTTRRPNRISSTRTIDTVREGQEMRRALSSRTSAPTSRRSSLVTGSAHQSHPSRRVSFHQDVEVVEPNEAKSTQTIGRAHGRTMSAMAGESKQQKRASTGVSYSAWMTSAVHGHRDEEVRAHAHSHVRGKRTPCYSAPSSPKIVPSQFPLPRQRTSSRLATSSDAGSGRRVETYNDSAGATSAAELAVLSSLSAAQNQFKSAGSLALALTRQLSAPLRPFLHLTLFASISSMAVIALAGFLVAGYLCTVWDDVNDRGKSLQRNVSTARSSIEKRIQWTRSVLGMSVSETNTGEEKTSSSSAEDADQRSSKPATTDPQSARKTRNSGSSPFKFVTAPLRFALAIPAAALVYVTPQGVRTAFAAESKSGKASSANAGHRRHAAGTGHRHSASAPAASASASGFANLPPRPPLSSLLPSIAFTIVIACSAGLASFFANRAAAAADPATTPTSSARATPNSSAPPSPSLHSRGARFDSHSSVSSSPSASGASPSAYYHRRHTQSISSLHSGEYLAAGPAVGVAGAGAGLRHVNIGGDSGRRSPFTAPRYDL